jgi:hypothetical protein
MILSMNKQAIPYRKIIAANRTIRLIA